MRGHNKIYYFFFLNQTYLNIIVFVSMLLALVVETLKYLKMQKLNPVTQNSEKY